MFLYNNQHFASTNNNRNSIPICPYFRTHIPPTYYPISNVYSSTQKRSTKQASCIIDKDYINGTIDPKLFGSFIEHLGRAIYTGIYEPGHPTADEQGFRKDVIQLVRELNISIVRYPGGNFVSGYDWTDGIGPRESRPRRLELAWQSIEPNIIGIDEFMDWAKKAHTEVMGVVNLGTGTPEEAGNLVEYCNFPSGTYWSDLRRKYGNNEPYNIKVWGLGNEMDGPWQIGQLSADDYGKKAKEAAKIMKWTDPTIELVAGGSSNYKMPTFPEWDRVILEYLYEHVDYISLHNYYEPENTNEIGDFLASFVAMDNQIHTIISTADYVKAKKRSNKILKLAFDEWNVWYMKNIQLRPWEIAPPLLEDNYSLLDALVVGGLLCTLLKNADRVKLACLAQLVNVIAPIFTQEKGPVIKQTTFYPFQQVSLHGRGEVIIPIVTCPVFETKSFGEVPILQSAVTYNREDSSISVFVLNCDEKDDVEFKLDFRSFGNITALEHIILDGPELTAKNSFLEPNKVNPRIGPLPKKINNEMNVLLPKLSWNMLRFCVVNEVSSFREPKN
jgi:alpha-N-arabinofuranosidase